MADDTPKTEPEAVDWEKRYKDEQSKISELANEKKVLADELSKSKQTLEAVQPFINWDAASGTPQEEEVDPKDLNKKINKMKADLSDEIAWSTFRSQNPELKGHEALVLSFVQKSTGTRDERLAKAKDLTEAYINNLREEGKKAALEQKEETVKAEAEAGGLSPVATPPSDDTPVTTSEVNNSYMETRKTAAAKARGFI